ncbi:MAG: hypothetical protein K9L31_02565 [Candidatus Pacebacteria bacterium]|nr:hypothetical protein [Candidatus Paceibacterota bacterium]
MCTDNHRTIDGESVVDNSKAKKPAWRPEYQGVCSNLHNTIRIPNPVILDGEVYGD